MSLWKNDNMSRGVMKDKNSPQRATQTLKIAAVRRVLAGERIRAVAQDLNLSYESLWRWKKQVVEEGEQRLRRVGRPSGRGQPTSDEGRQKRIEELERLVGRQQMEIRFLDKALHRVEELRQARRDDGGRESSKR
jgi:transposase